jgi:cobalt-precorrin 5A hydrolase
MTGPLATAVYALTAGGARVARRIADGLDRADLFLPRRLEPGGFERLAEALAANWDRYPVHVVVAASGIVVRSIAPLLVHKTIDPAVVVVDETGRFALSLVSGHLGGANLAARRVAELTDGLAVITTATDAAGRPALDTLAAEQDLAVDNVGALSAISRMVLEDEPVPVYDPGRWLTQALAPWPECFRFWDRAPADRDRPLVFVGPQIMDPPGAWLFLRPPCLFLGLGCNRDTGLDEIEALVGSALAQHRLSPASVAGLASVEVKRDEPALLDLAERMKVPIRFFGRDELNTVTTPNPSGVVEKHLGVKSVCEAAAILAAGGGRLIIPKQKSLNATLAAACSGSSVWVPATFQD